MTGARRTIVGPDGRAKVYRPLPPEERAAGIRAGLEAYGRGDYFLAHELMEPAWMGADDHGERAITQGLIKLAAAEVHRVRGNPRGIAKNLKGARWWLQYGREAGAATGVCDLDGLDGLDVEALIATIDERLVSDTTGAHDPISLSRRRS